MYGTKSVSNKDGPMQPSRFAFSAVLLHLSGRGGDFNIFQSANVFFSFFV